MDPMNAEEAPTADAAPKVGTELLLESLKRTEQALMILIQNNGRLAAKLGNALRRIDLLEAEAQYQGLLFGNLYQHLELEPPARPVRIDQLIGNLMHPTDEGYDPVQNGALRIKFHEDGHPIYGTYEVLITDPNGGSPVARPMETLHPKAQELIASEFQRLRTEGKLDPKVFYGTNFQARTVGAMSEDSVQAPIADPMPAGEPQAEAVPVVLDQHDQVEVEAPAPADEQDLVQADVELGAEPPHPIGENDADHSERS